MCKFHDTLHHPATLACKAALCWEYRYRIYYLGAVCILEADNNSSRVITADCLSTAPHQAAHMRLNLTVY